MNLNPFGCFEQILERKIAIFGSALDFQLFFNIIKGLMFLRLIGGWRAATLKITFSKCNKTGNDIQNKNISFRVDALLSQNMFLYIYFHLWATQCAKQSKYFCILSYTMCKKDDVERLLNRTMFTALQPITFFSSFITNCNRQPSSFFKVPSDHKSYDGAYTSNVLNLVGYLEPNITSPKLKHWKLTLPPSTFFSIYFNIRGKAFYAH